MIYSGAPYYKKTRKAHGVTICLDRIATNVWKDSGSEWEPNSDRIIKIRLHCAPIHITVIAVYSPINPVTKPMGDESDKFYADLQDTINDVSTNDMLIIVGDLNAQVGKNQQKRQQHLIRSSVGPFTVDIENENGSRLIDFCEINNILLSNTFFKHKKVHQTS
jgi:exonuclease III